jgi:hypothetical protein
MHYRPPGRSGRRIVPRRLGTTLEVDDGIVRIGRARGIRRSGSAPLAGARVAMRRVFHGAPRRHDHDHDRDEPLAALVEGFQSAFLACTVPGPAWRWRSCSPPTACGGVGDNPNHKEEQS